MEETIKFMLLVWAIGLIVVVAMFKFEVERLQHRIGQLEVEIQQLKQR